MILFFIWVGNFEEYMYVFENIKQLVVFKDYRCEYVRIFQKFILFGFFLDLRSQKKQRRLGDLWYKVLQNWE